MNIELLFESVDWKNIPLEDVEQIKHEALFWYKDYSKLQHLSNILDKDIETFSIKFSKWIDIRIEMVLQR